METPGGKRGLATDRTRRYLIGGGVTLAGLGGLGYIVYRNFGGWIRRMAAESAIPVEAPLHFPNPKLWPDKGLYAAWLGHSTVLIKADGYTILTDPVFGDKAGIDLYVYTLGIKRIVAPALTAKDLPPIDLILSSHAHMDHLDTRSLRSLENKQTQIVMAVETSDLIRASRYAKTTELRWGAAIQVGAARVKAFEVNHWGARMRTDTYRGYNGYTVEVNGRRILFAGDTALTDTFRDLKDRRGYDLAILPIGAYNPWIRYHCNPEQAFRMGNDAGAEILLPVHHQTFRLSNEPPLEPIERFLDASVSRPERVGWTAIGQEFRLA